MIVVDVEASGVSPEKHSLVSIGAVDFSNPKNTFYEECRIWEGAHVDREAMEVNGFTDSQIHDRNKKLDKEILIDFLNWSENITEKTIAGHNPSFDRDFLQATAYRYHINWPMAHRTIDLHTVCYFDMIRKGITPPTAHGHSSLNSDSIYKYLGLPDEPAPHNALTGALMEAEAFSRLFNKVSIIETFAKYPVL